ncbi:MAG: hypothetical protein ABIG63_04425, partial [Chloroflexota bacterium]
AKGEVSQRPVLPSNPRMKPTWLRHEDKQRYEQRLVLVIAAYCANTPGSLCKSLGAQKQNPCQGEASF